MTADQLQALINVANNPNFTTWEQRAVHLNTLFGTDYTESKWRKDYAAYTISVAHDPTPVIEELQQLEDSIYIESYKLKRHNTYRRKLLREMSQIELVIDSIIDSIEPYIPRTPSRPPMFHTPSPYVGHILAMADAHYGRIGVNIEDKLQLILSETKDYADQFAVQHLNVLVLGDMIDGLLRTTQFQFIEKLPFDQVFEFSDIFASFLFELNEIVPITVHYSTSSNHTENRPLNSDRLDFVTEDYERVIAKFLQKSCPHLDIRTYEQGIIDFALADFNILAMHGHQFSKKAGQIQELSFQRGKRYDYMYYGHYHHESSKTVAEAECHNIQAIGVPALTDTDEYAQRLGSSSKAGVLLEGFTKQGRKMTSRVIL